MTEHADIWRGLLAPFGRDEIKTRPQGGRQLSYVTARTVMNRLDEVLGPENWWDDYAASEHSVLCRLTVRLPDGRTITKCDAGGYAGMSDQGDDDKSGYSDAFKRAAVKFGVGRHLYQDGLPRLDGEAPPAPPEPRRDDRPAPAREPRQQGGGNSQQGGEPRSGRALFAWVKDLDEQREYGLLKHLNAWGKLREFPNRMVDWDGPQIVEAFAEAQRKIRTIEDMRRQTEAHEGRDDQWEDGRE